MAEQGMDADVFEAFVEQLKRFVRERLVPAEKQVAELGRVPGDIIAEMRAMGLFGITMPVEHGGAGVNVSQYIETIRQISWASPAYRSIISINIGMTCSAIVKSGTKEQKAYWLPRLVETDIVAFG